MQGRYVSKELESRNQVMYQMYASGKSRQAIANQFGISRQAVSRIIARYVQDDGLANDDEARALHRAQLDGMMTHFLAMAYAPPPPAFDVKGAMLRDECMDPDCTGWVFGQDGGRYRCTHGEPVRDLEGNIHAGTLALKISDAIRRMDAIDKARKKQLPENEAMAQMKEWLANLPRAEVIDPSDDE
jgi:hypothetical protein